MSSSVTGLIASFSRNRRPKTSKRWRNKGLTLRCYKCNDTKHLRKNCSKKRVQSPSMESLHADKMFSVASTRKGNNSLSVDRQITMHSGASEHAVKHLRYFCDVRKIDPFQLRMANGLIAQASYKGTVAVNQQYSRLNMVNSYFVPSLSINVVFCVRLD